MLRVWTDSKAGSGDGMERKERSEGEGRGKEVGVCNGVASYGALGHVLSRLPTVWTCMFAVLWFQVYYN